MPKMVGKSICCFSAVFSLRPVINRFIFLFFPVCSCSFPSKWAYGVTLWELMTLGQQPYGNIDAFEMLNFLKQGHRISQPVNCPDELFTVIACCWALSEDERPGFGQMIVCLTDFLNALSNFI